MSISSEALDANFHNLWPHIGEFGCVHLPILTQELRQFLPQRVKVIGKVLRTLFGILKHEQIAWEGLAPRLSQVLDNILNRDLWPHRKSNGLSSYRSHFVILAGFARMTHSKQLARILTDFFWDQRRCVLEYERTAFLYEWATAIEELRGLVSHQESNRCLSYLARKVDSIHSNYHKSGLNDPRMDTIIQMLYSLLEGGSIDYGRGRRHARFLPDIQRARTMPPRFQYHHPQIHSPPPEYLLPYDNRMIVPALPSPSPSMDLALQNGYVDEEMDLLKFRQEMLENKVEQLEMGIEQVF